MKLCPGQADLIIFRAYYLIPGIYLAPEILQVQEIYLVQEI
jgi:hypothetical protein